MQGLKLPGLFETFWGICRATLAFLTWLVIIVITITFFFLLQGAYSNNFVHLYFKQLFLDISSTLPFTSWILYWIYLVLGRPSIKCLSFRRTSVDDVLQWVFQLTQSTIFTKVFIPNRSLLLSLGVLLRLLIFTIVAHGLCHPVV